MKDTDWRPSPCPSCGETRAAAKHPKCDNKHCDVGPFINSKQPRSMATERHYIWSKQGHALVMLNDLQTLFKNPEFDPDQDKIYELGPEVKLELTVKVSPAKPISREHTSSYRPTFENRD